MSTRIDQSRPSTVKGIVHRLLFQSARHGLHAGVALVLVAAAPAATAQLFPAEFELSALRVAGGGDGSAGVVLNGINDQDLIGHSVSAAGDVNGDGIDDLIVGAYRGDPGGRHDAGESFIVFGRRTGFATEFELSSLLAVNGGDGSSGVVLNGINDFDRLGISVSAAGDVNGDGVDDVIVGAFLADPGGLNAAGESYVVFGNTSGFSAEIELSSLLAANGGDGSVGMVLSGLDSDDELGHSVSAAGDVNGDGIDDLIVGAHRGDPGGVNGAGESYVVFGNTSGFAAEFELSSLLAANGGDGSAGVVLNGIDDFDDSGLSVSAAGDVNGDGIDDVIIGAHRGDPGGRNGAGESYVVFGNTSGFGAEFELSSLLAANGGDGSAGVVLNGIDEQDHAGSFVSAAGDVNGDGISDVIIDAKFADPDGRGLAGESYVVFGNAAGFAAEFELSSLLAANSGDGSAGIVIKGIDDRDSLGESAVSGAGDVNGDGIDDLIIGASSANPNGRADAGESYLVFGSAAGFPAEFQLFSLLAANGGDGNLGVVFNGNQISDFSGTSVSAAGDVNADGIDDLIIGAPFANPGVQINAGEGYLIFGRGEDGDSDGVADIADNCPLTANADQTDGDGDSVGDLCDNCLLQRNPDQCDTDGDHFGNICDADLDNNNIVNTVDLRFMVFNFGLIGANVADLTCDGRVNFLDVREMRIDFGQPPGPSGVGP